MGNGESSGGGCGGRDSGYSTGYGGSVCTKQDIMRAANATNSTSDTIAPGAQVSGMISAFQGDVKYQCAPENISSPGYHYVETERGGHYIRESSRDWK